MSHAGRRACVAEKLRKSVICYAGRLAIASSRRSTPRRIAYASPEAATCGKRLIMEQLSGLQSICPTDNDRPGRLFIPADWWRLTDIGDELIWIRSGTVDRLEKNESDANLKDQTEFVLHGNSFDDVSSHLPLSTIVKPGYTGIRMPQKVLDIFETDALKEQVCRGTGAKGMRRDC